MKLLVLVKNYINFLDNNFDLSPDRKTRADIFTSDYEKQKFISAEKITVDEIKKIFGINNINICGNVGEKPYLNNYHDISFSRSYDNNFLFLGIENLNGCIGVDCESTKKVDYNLMKYFFTDLERMYVEKSEDKNFAFTLIWTRKESYIKCLGKGLEFKFNLLDTTPKYDMKLNKNNETIFGKNQKINDMYINSYFINNVVISVCSSIDDKFPSVIQKGW